MSASATQSVIRTFVIFLSLIIGFLLISDVNSYAAWYNPDNAITYTEKRIHPDFNFSELEDLNQRLSALPPLSPVTAKRFLSLAGKMLDMDANTLRLVTKKHAMSSSFIPEKLIPLDDYPQINTTRTGMKISYHILQPLLKMFEEAKEDGINLFISSAYRSYSLQEDIFNYFTETRGSEWTSLYSAPPGHSQHQLGTTVDFTPEGGGLFANSPEEIWIRENGGKFGWSLSYPKGKSRETGYEWESWHWRWIGEDTVKMQNEFFNGMQQDVLSFWFDNQHKLRAAHTPN